MIFFPSKESLLLSISTIRTSLKLRGIYGVVLRLVPLKRRERAGFGHSLIRPWRFPELRFPRAQFLALGVDAMRPRSSASKGIFVPFSCDLLIGFDISFLA